MNKGEWTLITGACGGLGRAFCDVLGEMGSNLFITGTDKKRTLDLLNTLKAKFPSIQVDFCVCNLKDPKMRDNVFKTLEKKNITLKRLINNAGYIVEGKFLDLPDEVALDVVRVNCEGTLDMTQKFIKTFKDNIEILTVSSLGGYYPMPYMSVYSASKSFLLNFMVALREEVRGKNIKVCILCPGGIPTTDQMKEAIKAQGLSGKLSSKSPRYIATCALKNLEKNRAITIPGTFNKILRNGAYMATKPYIAKFVGSRWKKASKKRNTLPK